MNLSVEAVLFDLDGVLVDSAGAVETAWKNWAIEHDLEWKVVRETCHGQPSRATIEQLAPHLDPLTEAAQVEAAQERLSTNLKPCPGATDVLTDLAHDRWAIVTSGSRQTALTRLKSAGLPIPEVLITADDVVAGKPCPEGYIAAANRLGVDPSECVVVEDAGPGATAGRLAGCTVLGIVGPLLQNTPVDAHITDLRDVEIVRATSGRYEVCAHQL